MNKKDKLTDITLALAILNLIAMVLMFLALDDITSGEANLDAEYITVKAAFFIGFLYLVISFITIRKIRKP